MPSELFLASSNQGKLAEFLAMSRLAHAQNHPLNLSLLPNFPSLPTFEETAPTFAENAAGKALHYSQFSDALVVADDSGLVVPTLGGRPGVRSARYAGPAATDQQRNEKLLQEMASLTGQARRAHFVCAIAAAQHGRAIAIVTARVDGEILHHAQGTSGFGYDPIFFVNKLEKSFAELSADQKNLLSHRGQAFRRLLQVLQ